MTTKVTLPDGRTVVVPSDDPLEAATAAKKFMDQNPAPVATPTSETSPLDALLPGPEPAQPNAPSASLLDQLDRGMQLGGQNVGKVASGLLGIPGELLGPPLESLGLGQFAPPDQADITEGFVDMLGSLGLGQGIIPEADKTPAERIGGQAVQFGGEAAVGSAGAIKTAVTKGGRALAGMLLPPDVVAATQAGKAGPILAGDVAGGTGAGVTMSSFQELGGGEAVRDILGPEAEAIANIVMAIGGGATGNVSFRAGRRGVRAFKGQDRPQNIPVDPADAKPFGAGIEKIAAEVMQRKALDPVRAADTLARKKAAPASATSRADFLARVEGRPQPDLESPVTVKQTTGQLADDFGIASLERSLRASEPGQFAARDASVNDELAGVVSSLAPEGNPRAFTESFETKAADRRSASAERVGTAEAAEEALATKRRVAGEELAAEGSLSPDKASEGVDAGVREVTAAETIRKNELFNAPEIAGETRSLGFLQDAIEAEQAGVSKGAAKSKETPVGFNARQRALRVFDEDGELISQGTMSVADLQTRRQELAGIQAKARKDGDFKLADSAGRLKKAIADDFEALAAKGDEAGEAAQKALDNFSERFGPTFRGSKGDPATEFQKAFALDKSAPDPSKTGPKFIRPASPERAASLARIRELSPEPKASVKAARQFLLADMVSAGVIDPKTGTVNGVRLGKWRRAWGDETLNTAAPGFADEVAGLVGKAKADEAAATALKAEAKAATVAAKLDEAAIMDGALGFALGRNPAKAVAKAFGGGDPQKAVAKIVAEIGDDATAKTGFKRAVVDHLVNKITNAPGKGTTAKPLSMAKLDKMFDEHAGALSEVFSPKEMNSLRQVSKILEEEAFVKSVQAISGSATEGLRQSQEQLKTALEGALKLHFGVLKGGGIMRVVNLGVKSVTGDLEGMVTRLLVQAHLDPELAAHLLKRDISKNVPVWNNRLQFLLQVGEGARATGEDDADE